MRNNYFLTYFILILPIFLIGCGSELAKVLGTDKLPPDEFTILTKPDLIIPPDYNLRPPAEGEIRPNPQQPSRELQAILFSNSSNSEDFKFIYSIIGVSTVLWFFGF